MNKKTKRMIKSVLVEEFYSKENGKIYWNWRFVSGKWNKELTDFKNFPFVELKFKE